MDLRKIAISENFPSKRKVVSRFGIGVGASLLIFTVFCINNPFNFSFLNATSGGFSPFPLFLPRQSAVISKSPPESLGFSKRDEEQEKSIEKTHAVNLPGYDKNLSFSGISVGDKGVEETYKTNFLENFEKRSSFSGEERVAGKTNDKNSSEMAKNVNFLNFGGEEMASKNTHGGNSSENLENRRSCRGECMVTGENLEGNPRENAKNASSLNFEGGETVTEETHKGNFSESIDGGNSFNREEMAIGRVKEGNLSGNDENVREEIGEKTHEGNFSKNFGKGNSFGKEEVIIKQNSDAKNSEFSNGGGRIFDKTHGGNVTKNDKNSSSVDITQEGNLSEKETKKIARSYDASASAKNIEGASRKCDIFNGRWVRDGRKPYYPAGSCPFIDKDFDCHGNGRPDDDFVKWRWQPNGCNIPSLNASDLLKRLRGKRLLFVGDSLNRNMWESLVCILHHSVVNKKKVYEVSGRKKFRMKGYYSFRFEDYNCSIDYVRSTYLVRESSVTHWKRSQDETLRLDLMDDTISVYREASVLVFNTGHWWTHEKTSKGKDYYQEGNYVYPMLKVLDAYAKALTTWSRWIDKNIDARRTRVFFRGYSPTHFSGRWNSGGQCHNETEPIFNESYLGNYPSKMRALEHVLEGMKTPVVYLNISRLTDYRKDGHPSIYRKEYKNDLQSQDCSHWCLPGVPDTWNELLYASLVMDD